MELVTKKKLMLFSGRANVPLATEIAESLGVPLGEVALSTFANGEIYCRYLESIRGADVFIVQSHSTPINEHLFDKYGWNTCFTVNAIILITATTFWFFNDPNKRFYDERSIPDEPSPLESIVAPQHSS